MRIALERRAVLAAIAVALPLGLAAMVVIPLLGDAISRGGDVEALRGRLQALKTKTPNLEDLRQRADALRADAVLRPYMAASGADAAAMDPSSQLMQALKSQGIDLALMPASEDGGGVVRRRFSARLPSSLASRLPWLVENAEPPWIIEEFNAVRTNQGDLMEVSGALRSFSVAISPAGGSGP